ncbi:MAG TPA: hypothetical protein VM282_11630 [Acidimicrobiales bacterium]|nr:hypothetical protein [Acidimicrobiales bacterium]
MNEVRSMTEGVSMKIVRPDFTPRLLQAHARPMLPRIEGPIRVGILHNRKQNADVLIGRLAANLAHDLGGVVDFLDAKDHAAIPAPVAMLDAAAAGAHIVFTGTGD